MQRKLVIGSLVSIRGAQRVGKVLALNEEGFYVVRWEVAKDPEGQRCIRLGEQRQYRRGELVALNEKGEWDDLVPNAAPEAKNLLTEKVDVPVPSLEG